MSFEVSIAMKQFVITTFILCVFSLNNGKCQCTIESFNQMITFYQMITECIWDFNYFDHSVYGDVSSLEGVKTFPSTTSSTSPENSNSFSILTKEFLNKPDGEVGKRNTLKPQPSGRSPTVRINGIDSNNNNNKLAETDDSDERQAYYYDKPKIPFNLPDSSNIQINTVPPKK